MTIQSHSGSIISGLVKNDIIIFGIIAKASERTVTESTDNHRFSADELITTRPRVCLPISIHFLTYTSDFWTNLTRQKPKKEFWRYPISISEDFVILTCVVFNAQCCAVMPQYRLSVCLSVCLSVAFRYRDHIDWNTSKIISRPNSLRFMLGLTPTSAIWSNGNTPKIGWNRMGSRAQKPAISPKRCKIGPWLLWRTNRKSHTRFWLVPKSMTLNDLEWTSQSF